MRTDLGKFWPLKAIAIFAMLGLMAAKVSGCAGGGSSPASQLTSVPNATAQSTTGAVAPIGGKVQAKVALLLPLSAKGQHAVVANGMKQAAELALFENNQPGFRLLVKDTKGTVEGARAAATTAAADGTELVIGPLFSSSVKAVSDVLRPAGIPIVAFSNNPQVAGNGTYLMSFLASEEVERIVSYAASRGRSQFAALISDDEYGKIVEHVFRQTVQRHGGIVVGLERYPPGTGGILEPARKLFEDIEVAKENGVIVDSLFIPGGPELLSIIAPSIKHAKIDTNTIKLLGTGGWDYPNIGRERAFVGGWFPSPDPRNWRSFSEKFSKANGGAPPRIASLAHNAVTIAIKLATANPKGQRYTAANLARPTGFNGVDGAVRFTAAGLPQRGLAVLEIQKFGNQVIDAAPQTFSGTVLGQAAPRSSFQYAFSPTR
ncbi:MAG: penicillin-binding protein activator [Pseudomonadota bacterium]